MRAGVSKHIITSQQSLQENNVFLWGRVLSNVVSISGLIVEPFFVSKVNVSFDHINANQKEKHFLELDRPHRYDFFFFFSDFIPSFFGTMTQDWRRDFQIHRLFLASLFYFYPLSFGLIFCVIICSALRCLVNGRMKQKEINDSCIHRRQRMIG